jgi:hypothetical protein
MIIREEIEKLVRVAAECEMLPPPAMRMAVLTANRRAASLGVSSRVHKLLARLQKGPMDVVGRLQVGPAHPIGAARPRDPDDGALLVRTSGILAAELAKPDTGTQIEIDLPHVPPPLSW